MWWRDDGRLWIVSNYGLPPERLAALTLAIEAGPDGVPMLTDPSMRLVGTNTLDDYQAIRQDWTFNGQSLTLAITNGGLAQQLSDLTASSIVELTDRRSTWLQGHPSQRPSQSDLAHERPHPLGVCDDWSAARGQHRRHLRRHCPRLRRLPSSAEPGDPMMMPPQRRLELVVVVSRRVIRLCVASFEDDHGRVGRRERGVGVEALVDLGPPPPQSIALVALDPAGAHRALRLALEADDGVG